MEMICSGNSQGPAVKPLAYMQCYIYLGREFWACILKGFLHCPHMEMESGALGLHLPFTDISDLNKYYYLLFPNLGLLIISA